MTPEFKKARDEAAQHEYPYAKSDMIFGWVCTECSKFNIMTWSSWSFYGPVDECCECEKAHHVIEPWSVFNPKPESAE